MDKSTSNKALKLALSALELQVELRERLRFRWADGPEQTALLLQCAKSSEHPNVKSALEKAAELFTEKQKSSLKSYGVDINALLGSKKKPSSDAGMTYRGAKVETSASTTVKEEIDDVPDEHKGKRKIIYRGQVKWVD